MSAFRVDGPMNVPMVLLTPVYQKSYGVPTKTFCAVKDGIPFFGTFKTYGGTRAQEKDVNGLYSIENTADIVTWYRPEITSACRVFLVRTGETYEIINRPENINEMNQYLKFKVREVKGGA